MSFESEPEPRPKLWERNIVDLIEGNCFFRMTDEGMVFEILYCPVVLIHSNLPNKTHYPVNLFAKSLHK